MDRSKASVRLLTGAAMACLLLLTGGCGGDAAGGEPAPSPTATPSPSPTPVPTPTPSPTAVADGDVFALADPGDDAADYRHYLAMDEVSGLAWRGIWEFVEPDDGRFDWSSLDAGLDEAAAAGKQITIHLFASGGGWPDWLLAAGAQTYSGTAFNGAPLTDPVPWDEVYLSRYDHLMRALADHLARRGQTDIVRAISVGAPVSEMSLIACRNNTLGEGAGAVQFDRVKYLSAWSSAAESALDAFPATTVVASAPVTQICAPDGDGEAFYSDLMKPLGDLGVFVADLTALGSDRYVNVAGDLRARPLLMQTIWSSTNDPQNRLNGSLADAMCEGRALGARYFEIYKGDLDSGDAEIATALERARGQEACP